MGATLSLILIVMSVVAYIAGVDQQTWYKWVSIIIFFGGIVYACMNYGKQLDGQVSFGNCFAYGFKTSAVITCFMLLFSVIFLLIFPEIKEKAMDAARKQMEERGGVTEDQIEAGIAFARKSFMLFLIVGVIFIYLIAGVIASLVGAGLTKKNPQSPFENQI